MFGEKKTQKESSSFSFQFFNNFIFYPKFVVLNNTKSNKKMKNLTIAKMAKPLMFTALSIMLLTQTGCFFFSKKIVHLE